MGIWKDMYGPRDLDFIEGVIAGVEMYAVWKDGRQYVGIHEKPFISVVLEIKKDLGYFEQKGEVSTQTLSRSP